MNTKCSLWLVVAALAGLSLAAPPSAACTDRPGTPDQLSVEPLSPTSIRFKFRITTRDTEINRFYDVEVEEVTPPAPPAQLPVRRKVKVLTGVRAEGPYFLGYGGIDHFDFTGLNPGKQHCARIRARTAAETQGCVSALWARPACADTPPEKGPPVVLGKIPTITVTREGGTAFRIKGSTFFANKPITIRVSGTGTTAASVTTAEGKPIVSDGSGRFDVKLTNICDRNGDVSFTATDGLRSTKTPAHSACRVVMTKMPGGVVKKP